MQRLLSLAALCVCATVSAQTVIDVTVPGNKVCSYTTGPVTSGATAGHLQATATGSTGTGCGSSTPTSTDPPVSFGPASPLSPLVATLPNTGGLAGFTFQPINATRCDATVTPSTGVTLVNPICNNTCTGSQSFSPTFPSNPSTTTDVGYTVKVTCTGLGSPTPGVDSPGIAQVTVGHGSGGPPDTCPTIPGSGAITSFTHQTGTQTMTSYGSGSTGSWSADITDLTSIFGTKPTSSAWPGNSGITADRLAINTNMYVSAVFTVPANYMGSLPTGSSRLGQYLVNNSGFSKAPVSMTISTSCGDFSNPATHPTSTVVAGCYVNSGTSLVWENPQHASPTCVLQDGQKYYLNIINANVTNVTPTGGTATTTKGATGASCTSSCTDPITNYIFN